MYKNDFEIQKIDNQSSYITLNTVQNYMKNFDYGFDRDYSHLSSALNIFIINPSSDLFIRDVYLIDDSYTNIFCRIMIFMIMFKMMIMLF